MHAPTGDQYHLQLDEGGRGVSAIVTEVAAGIRSLEVGGTALVESFPESSTPPGAAGIVLVPWPNRVAGGLWHHEGEALQLDITEPKTGNAIHGLLRFTGYRLLEREAHRVLQGASVFPQHGWPFLLATTVEHALVADGMVVTHTVANESAEPAPVAVGAHPYLRVGEVPVEELTLTVDAATRILTDAKQIPIGEEPVEDTEADLRGGRLVGGLAIDHGYTDVGVVDGRSAHSLTAPDGRRVELWADASFPVVQVFTPTAFAAPEGPRRAVALEPMTAPADALNSGTGLRYLQPGESWTLQWGIRLAVG
ncbi:aldose 1-epimerase family protein [Herbiconiux moechotypicola]|uniref:Aldose 1-epimerase family protein n=1 Tax=Herbiconiux moechotypicola TaxID=637393 RepID=A0ABN3DS10_9MICO|nr:aldose 1-epimerase family protein [Herbiconiux moechotypicola]MCS5730649.1 aldose 1-epimerase family protein [Herbiconiux moechotypicola]